MISLIPLAIILFTKIVKISGVGIVLYISINFEFKIRVDLTPVSSDEFKSYFCRNCTTPYLKQYRYIGVVYQPPHRHADLFNNLFEAIISEINNLKNLLSLC